MVDVDLVGQKFGKLTVLSRERINNKPVWKCQCDCGNITYVNTGHLRSGHTTSCGCNKYKLNPTNNIGKRIKDFVIIGPDTTRKKYTIVKCLRCGTIYSVRSFELFSGKYECCANCKRKQLSEINNSKYIGKQYGKLLVLEQDPAKKYHWICKCDCGNIISVHVSNLLTSFAPKVT